MLKDYLRWGIYAAIFATPFIGNYVADGMFFPFITGKNFGFRIDVEIMTALYIVLALVDSTVRPKYTHLLGAFGAFIAIIFAADVFGADPHKSLWSNYERSEGFVTHIHLFLYFVVMMCTMRTEKIWAWFGNSWLLASVAVFYHGILQRSGAERFYMGGNRVDALLGNAEYIGIYGLFNAFLAALLFVRTPRDSEYAWVRYWYPVIGAANVALMMWSQTRGSVIGFFAGSILALGLFGYFDKSHPKLRQYSIMGTAALVILIASFIAVRKNPVLKPVIEKVPVVGRIADIKLSEGTAKSRLVMWGISWEGFKERPMLGWGQENFIQVFSEKFTPEASAYEPWYDRSHDVFFDWLIAAGALGLLAYLSLYAVALYYLWMYEGGSRFTIAEKSIVTGMLGGYFIHNIFVFDNLVSYMFFFGVLAWVASRAMSNLDTAPSRKVRGAELDSGDVAVVAAVVFTVFAVLIYWVNIRNINANEELILTMQGGQQTEMRDGKQYLRIAPLVEDGMIGTNEAREQLIQQSIAMAQQAQEGKLDSKVAQEYLKLADEKIQDRLDENPRDLRMLSFAITFYGQLGQMDRAEELYAKAIAVSPHRGALYLSMAQLRANAAMNGNGDFSKALDSSEKAVENMPGNGQALGLHAIILAYAKRGSEIDKDYEKLGDVRDGQARMYFAQAYKKVGADAKAQAALQRAVEDDPSLAEKLSPKTAPTADKK